MKKTIKKGVKKEVNQEFYFSLSFFE